MLNVIKYIVKLGCWELDPHKRPTFKEILSNLEDIQRSAFSQTPNESFQKLQNGWKKEINEVLQDLCKKEKVGVVFFLSSKKIIFNCAPQFFNAFPHLSKLFSLITVLKRYEFWEFFQKSSSF